jgi:hypothetical protein
MKKIIFIFGLLFGANLLAQQVDPQEFYLAVLTDDMATIKTMLAQKPESISFGRDEPEMGMAHIVVNWCTNKYVDKETVKQVTKLLSANLNEKGKTDVIIQAMEFYETGYPASAFEKLKCIVQNVSTKADLQFLGYTVPDFVDLNMLSSDQVTEGLNDLIDKAKDANRAKSNDLLTKAEHLSYRYFWFDKDIYKTMLGKINAVTKEQLGKDEKLLTTRINEYFKGNDEYTVAVQKMVKQILDMNGLIEGKPDEALLSDIILGTPDRNFEDGLLYRLKDMNAKVDALITFLFFGVNDNIIYMGTKYSIIEVFEDLLVEGSFYTPSILDDAYKTSSNMSWSILKVLDKEYLVKNLFPSNKNVFRTIEGLQKMFPVE